MKAKPAAPAKKLSHIDTRGQAHMVDVSAKNVTERTATAEGRVIMRKETLDLVIAGNALKGDVLGAARLAGIMAAKRTHGLIPLCHPLPITKVEIDINPEHALPGFLVQATVKVAAQTGVEMEALTAVSIACLTIYDMVKAVERGMHIEGIRLLHKSGGKSGEYRAEDLMLCLPVAEALARILADAAPLPAEDAEPRRRARPRARRRSQSAAHAAARGRLGHGRLRRARRGRRRRRRRSRSSARSPPGIPSTARSATGEAARIFTGGVMPQAPTRW